MSIQRSGGEQREQVTGAGAAVPVGGFKCAGAMRAANLGDLLTLDSGFSQCCTLLGLDVLTLQRAEAAAQYACLACMRFDPPHYTNQHGGTCLGGGA